MTLLIDDPAMVTRDVGVVVVTGPDRLGYLHTLLSQHLEDAAPGTATDFLHLDAKGNALGTGRAVVRHDDVLCVTPPPVAGGLAEALERFKFLTDVTATDDSASWTLASLRGPGLPAVADAPELPMTAGFDAGGVVVRDRSGGLDLLGPPDWVEKRVSELGLPTASEADWEAWRIAAGEPGWYTEIASGRRTQELGLLPTHVHLRKGCYPGQESIAKTYNLGRPRRALAVVELDGPVESGSQLEAGGKAAEVTSAAPRDEGWVAFVLVPLDREGGLRGGGELSGDGVRGRVVRRVGEGLPQPGA